MYLKTICELTADAPLVPISTLADRLGISPVSATEMVHRMKDDQLVEHLPYKGIRLTALGRGRALSVVRRHRLWEVLLSVRLRLAWDQVHDLACRLEHAADRQVIEALATFLGQPSHCPHGNPIPTREGKMTLRPGRSLDSMTHGQEGIVLRVQPESHAVLSFLSSRGIQPGTILTVQSVNRFDGLWTVSVGGREEVIGRSVATRLVLGNGIEGQESSVARPAPEIE
jgi:DtxR family Mn-dependent transcriptional regulator